MPRERAWETERNVASSPSSRILPSSGRWKPVMVLSRVLLPAPLSPISPSTSRSRSPSGPPRATQPCDVDVEDHGYKDGDAQDDVEGVGAYALQGESVAEDSENQRPEERARNGPDPAEEGR